MAAVPIRFTLIEAGEDVRPYDFTTDTVQIGCDPDRGDNLLISLPKSLRHVRAKIIRGGDYVELEVKGGPIWLQGSRMEEGDVAELNVGDFLVFGTKKERGAKLRFEYAKEAEIVLDDVADWSVGEAPKPKRGGSAEDAFLFEEEEDEYAGMNAYQKSIHWYRKQYKKFTKWRKKAAKVTYWLTVAKVLWQRAGQAMMMIGGFAGLGYGWYNTAQQKLHAEDQQELSAEREKQAVLAEKQSAEARNETMELMRQCGCDSTEGVDQGSVAAADAILMRFDDDTLAPERTYAMPNKQMASLASVLSPKLAVAQRYGNLLNITLDRVCSPTKDKDRMDLVQAELTKFGLHEVYSFIPFVESQWCELGISPTGPRGMMQFTRGTAQEAFRKIDATQAEIPNYDWTGQRQWMTDKSSRFGGYYSMLARCPATISTQFKQKFYNGETNSQYPRRLDPADPRTDWEWSTKAAFSWLETLDRFYRDKGFRDLDAVLLAMTAYNQGQTEVGRWIKAAKERYGVEKEAALVFVQVLGGAMVVLEDTGDAEKRRQIKEGMNYAPKIMGYYLFAADKLDARGCR